MIKAVIIWDKEYSGIIQVQEVWIYSSQLIREILLRIQFYSILSIVTIKNPGTIVKNKKGIISLKTGRLNKITRSVINNIKIVMINHSLA